ncbi:MAG TPA: hypothetical protein VF656_20075 [Pyrinomonadaceae bacterium]|jgi:hypothetical protein
MPANITTADPNLKETCTEFRLKVMIYSPEAAYKFDVTVQRKCFPAKWLLIFSLYKKSGSEFAHIVDVEFEAEKKEEQKALEEISRTGMNALQSRAFSRKVYPRVKAGKEPTEIHDEISKAIQRKPA